MGKHTQEQEEVLNLIITEGLTPKQISIRRQTSTQNTYKIIGRLKKKGGISKTFGRVAKNLCTMQPQGHKIRLHGQEFCIGVLGGSKKYDKVREKSNFVRVRGHSVRLFTKSLEIYSSRSFYGDSVHDAVSSSVDHWNRFFVMLENEFDIIILKDRYQNIKLVKAHFAEVNNELARDCEVRGDKIKFRCNRDGKVYAIIDNSFNLHEFETVHPVSSQGDMAVFKPFFDDIRDKPHLVPSVQKECIDDIIKALSATVKVVDIVVKLQKSVMSPPDFSESIPKNELNPEYIG